MNIDFSYEADYLYYADSLNDIDFELESDFELDDIADEIRMKLNYPPLFKEVENMDDNGWYTFKLNVDIENQKVNAIYCVVVADDCPDNGEEYNLLSYTSIDNLWDRFIKLLSQNDYTLESLKEEILQETNNG